MRSQEPAGVLLQASSPRCQLCRDKWTRRLQSELLPAQTQQVQSEFIPLQTRQSQLELMQLRTRRSRSQPTPEQTQQAQSELMALQARLLRLELRPLQTWQWQSELHRRRAAGAVRGRSKRSGRYDPWLRAAASRAVVRRHC